MATGSKASNMALSVSLLIVINYYALLLIIIIIILFCVSILVNRSKFTLCIAKHDGRKLCQ